MAALTRSRVQPLAAGGAALVALYLVVFAIVGSSAFARAPDRIALGVTLDLTVTATLIVWWFGVRRQALPSWVAVATFSWGITMARAWVPHAPLGALVAVGGVVEVATMCWLLLRIRRVVRTARAARDEGPIGSIEAGLVAARIPARVAAILATELAVVGLVLTGWFRRPRRGAFSMRSTGWLTIAGLIGFLVIGETVATHLLLAMWSPLVAWIATASSAYLLLWLIGDAQAIRLHPVAITGATLRVSIGIRWRAAIPLSAIASVTEVRVVPDGAMNLALMEPTVLVTLRAPAEIRGLLGRRRHADRLALTIDDPKAFIAAVA
jgi:hypothetical protein